MSAIYGEAVPYVEGGSPCGGCRWTPFWGLNGSLAVTDCDDLTMTISAGNGDIGAMQLDSAGNQIETAVPFLALYRVTLTGYAGKGTDASWATRPDATWFNEVLLIPDTGTVEFYYDDVSALTAAFDPTVANYIRIELQQSLWRARIWPASDVEPGAWTFSGAPVGAGTRIAWNRFEFVDNSVTSGPLVASVQVLSSSVEGCCSGDCHPLDTFDRPDIETEFGIASSCLPWTVLSEYAYIFENEGRLDGILDPAGGGTAGGGRGGGWVSLDLSSGTLEYPFDVIVNFRCDSDQDDLTLPGDQVESQFIVIALDGGVGSFLHPEYWRAFVQCGYSTNPIFQLEGHERWVAYWLNGYNDTALAVSTFVADAAYVMTVHVALDPDPVTFTIDGNTISVPGLPADSGPPPAIRLQVGSDNVTPANGGPIVVPFTVVTEVDIPQFVCADNGGASSSSLVNYAHVFPPESTAGGITS